MRVGLDAEGNIAAWGHQVAGQSIMKGTPFESFAVQDGIDHSTVEGLADSPYTIPNISVGLTDVKKATTVLWWRSVGHTHRAYVMEVMMDMAAKAVSRDPVEFRLAYLEGGGDDAVRKAGVLKLVAEKGNWGQPAAGNVQGIAVHKSSGSYVAEIVEISGSLDNGIQIEKSPQPWFAASLSTRTLFAPKQKGRSVTELATQCASRLHLTVERWNGGTVEQFNFPDYEPLRISDIKSIVTHIVPSAEAQTGIGEPGTPPAAPALANAVAQLDVRIAENGPLRGHRSAPGKAVVRAKCLDGRFEPILTYAA